MTKWIDVPSDCWNIIELFEEELVADNHVVHHVIVMSTSLIVHGPTSVDKLELVALNELAHLFLFFLSLAVEPHREELHLDVGKHLGLVENEGVDDRVKNLVHISDSDGHI